LQIHFIITKSGTCARNKNLRAIASWIFVLSHQGNSPESWTLCRSDSLSGWFSRTGARASSRCPSGMTGAASAAKQPPPPQVIANPPQGGEAISTPAWQSPPLHTDRPPAGIGVHNTTANIRLSCHGSGGVFKMRLGVEPSTTRFAGGMASQV